MYSKNRKQRTAKLLSLFQTKVSLFDEQFDLKTNMVCDQDDDLNEVNQSNNENGI